MSNAVSSTSGFSPMTYDERCENRFNGFTARSKPLKRLAGRWIFHARLKPGANETS